MFSSLISSFLRPLLSYWVRKTRPQTRGTILIPGLKERVRIRWGPHAIPHIFAADEHDLFLAQGYLHAQERLWQMDLNRRFLSGRLAETLGEKPVPWRDLSIRFRNKSTADLDYFIRLMGIRRTSLASLRMLPHEFVDRLQAYSEGVNRYIEDHLNCLPIEFRLLRYQPEPWRPEDSLTIGKGFAFFLSSSLFTRLVLVALGDKLSGQEAKLRSLYPTYPAGEPCITRFAANDAKTLLRFLNGTFQETDGALGGQGSNNWVVAPPRSLSGRAILCNDPHLRMTLPSVWYLTHLKAMSSSRGPEGFEVWGASIPGSPCVHLGHNRWIAWGVTAALCDDADLYREKVHPRDPDRYLVGDEWVKTDSAEERIRIRGGKEISKGVRFTRHGPIISDFTENGGEEVLALKWTAHDPSEELRALYGVNGARNWDEFLRSLSFQAAPSLNYVYADVQGNIGYSLAGKIPIRPEPRSFLPLPGWSGEFEWKGYIPFGELPRLYNPPEGVIATANNRITDNSYPYYLSDLFEPPYRIQRIRELLTPKKKLSLEDMASIQRDTVSAQAKGIIGDLKTDLEEIACRDGSLKKVAEALLRWDGDCSEESPEAALWHAFHQRLMVNLLAPDLGQDLFIAYAEILNQSLVPMDQILRDPQSPWFHRYSRQSLVEKSLRQAQAELTSRLGADLRDWSWGRLHTLTLAHPLGQSKILKSLFCIGPFPAPGDGVTIHLGFYRHSDPYQQVVGPSLRMMIVPGDWERSCFILPSGQSGHFFSPHYRDQTELWRRGGYIRLFYEEESMDPWPLLILTPAGTPHEKLPCLSNIS